MRHPLLAASAAILAASACTMKDTAAPDAPPTYRLTATVTENNSCAVTVMAKTYSSIGQIRGDVPSKFIGTIPDKSYHGFGCWVATDGGDGDLIILFSGNNLGKPLDVGTYPLRFEILDNTPPMMAQVSFRPSALGGDNLRTTDGAAGSVVVESTPSGGRQIRADVDVVRWGSSF
ncbi:MAG: hypothetical protein Q7S20_00215 [Gemmatimonadaceae bacterium]|nr:hypothetical protein [Gemmatimonadaceae bacterium]